jgi:2,4-diaminopentanoate dehydrogenase
MTCKVIQWGTGYTGSYALKYILMHPGLELVGVKCHTAEKEGRDAGELAGGEAAGIKATRDGAALLSLGADCVVYMPRDPLGDPTVPDSPSEVWLSELCGILESGHNVVTSIASGTHHKHLHDGERFRARLDDACRKGGSSLLFAGFDPGFSDILAITMTGAVGGITAVRTWEICDYSTYPIAETLTQMGYGVKPEDLPAGAMAVVKATWGGVPYLLGDALGLVVDDIAIDADLYLAPESFTAPGGLYVEKGTVAGLRFTVSGLVGGVPMLSVNHVTRIGTDMAPDWPSIGRDGGYRVEIDSFPPFRGDYPMGLPGGTGSTFADAMAMTAGRCVNCVEAIVQAAPGYRSVLDLPLMAGRAIAPAR